MTHAHLPAELVQAMTETHYKVFADVPFTMHIGQPCPELKAIMAEHNALSAALITAWNPFSQRLSVKENNARQDELTTGLKKRGLVCIDGIGQHPHNEWPGEVSVLVLSLNREAAKVLARHYDQHAFVWVPESGIPELRQA
jgi:hypothetical protein